MRTEQTAGWWWFIPQQKRVMEIGRLHNARFEDTSHKLPAGGMLSTPANLARLADGVIGGTYLSEAMRREMLAEQRTRDGEGTSWSLGWSVDGPVVGLSGGQPGASALLSTIPSAGFAVAILANRDLAPIDDLLRTLRALWGHEPET